MNIANKLKEKYIHLPYTENLLKISEINKNTLLRILAGMKDIPKFNNVEKIYKLIKLKTYIDWFHET